MTEGIQKECTILIIEDTLTYQQALKRTFSAKNYLCACVSSGEEGLDLLKKVKPDLIILDLFLPGISGRDVCHEVKMDIKYRHIPVMMLTMQKEDKSVVEGLEAGADSYVNKNESLDVIVRRAEALIKLTNVVEPILKEDLGIGEEELEFKNKRILLVDDDITYLQAMKRELKNKGYEVITAMSGEECFEKLKIETPDLMLLDLRMPEIDGADVCRKLRSIRKFHGLPVVMLTASDSQNDVVRSFEAGITDYVVKSADFVVTHLRIYSILRRKHFEEETRKIRAKLTDAEQAALAAKMEKEIEKRFSTELAQKNEALEQEINARKRIEGELIRSNRDLEQFAYAASHDLQAPLRHMVAFSEILSQDYKDKLDSNATKYIERIIEGGKRMQNMIQGLLDFAKAGNVGKEMGLIAINKLVDEAIKNLEGIIHENQASVQCDNLPELYVNKVLIIQLFQNLISNALKYRKKDENPTIRINAQELKNEWEFSVADNGIGINPEHLPKLFKIFTRLHADTAYPGLGLGLAMCEKYVRIHHGRIWIESQENIGTTFKFTLLAQSIA